MKLMTYRDPFIRELTAWRNAMENMLNEAPAFQSYSEERPWALALDVIEDEDKFIVKASLPGVKPEDMDITVSDNVLTIKGEIKQEEIEDEGKYHLRERRYGMFQRSITLPVAVNTDKIEAIHEEGVLTLIIPKVEEVKPKRINVKTA